MAPMNQAAIQRRLGIQDPRGFGGIFSAGAPVYNGGSPSAHSGGGPQFGRPPENPMAGGMNQGGISPGSMQAGPDMTTLLGSISSNQGGSPPLNNAVLKLLLSRMEGLNART